MPNRSQSLNNQHQSPSAATDSYGRSRPSLCATNYTASSVVHAVKNQCITASASISCEGSMTCATAPAKIQFVQVIR
jgi:hypothetical protein